MVWFILTYFFMLSLVTFISNRREFHKPREVNPDWRPPVSIVIPVYNEEETIANTIESTLKLNYPEDRLEIIVVNDGSRDGTGEICRKYAADGKIKYLENNPNQGKSEALNRGMEYAKTEYVACIDADTVIEKDILLKTLPHFDSPDVAAVAAAIKVKEAKNVLQKVISIEYALANAFYNKIWSYLNCMFVTPGQFSIYRREKVLELGGFDKHNLVEDMELAYRMNKHGMQIAVCTTANAYTVVPGTLRDFYYQRKRWYSGTIQTILKHRDVILNPRLGSFGLYFVPFNYGGLVIAILLSMSFLTILASNANLVLENSSLVHFDIISQFRNYMKYVQFDLFYISKYHLLGLTPMALNLLVSLIALKSIGHRVRDNLVGFLGWLFFFIPYQILWIMCMYFVAFKKEVKWRAGM
jgi:cellulose synthase/poly-beta-1,6-N-acetylglucosamine synthase-like glycosyltransferase